MSGDPEINLSQSQPLVSIVIPVYNGSNFLAQAIDSALAQTYSNIEVVVVNDGSSDCGATERICHSYGDRIKYFSKPNGGVSSALNFGIEKMAGEYFSWLSHDDTYYPEKTERQITFLQDNPSVRILGAGLDIIDDEGNIIGNYVPEADKPAKNGREVMDTWVHGCSLIIDRKVFDEVGWFNVSNRTVQDLEMWLDIAFQGIPFHFIPEILCQWRKHEESGSFKGRQDHFNEVEQFFTRLLPRYSLNFFAKEHNAKIALKTAEIYEWLGEQARHRGARKIARVFFGISWLRDPNLLRASSRLRLRKYLSQLVNPKMSHY